jgi:hypothetical protein
VPPLREASADALPLPELRRVAPGGRTHREPLRPRAHPAGEPRLPDAQGRTGPQAIPRGPGLRARAGRHARRRGGTGHASGRGRALPELRRPLAGLHPVRHPLAAAAQHSRRGDSGRDASLPFALERLPSGAGAAPGLQRQPPGGRTPRPTSDAPARRTACPSNAHRRLGQGRQPQDVAASQGPRPCLE